MDSHSKELVCAPPVFFLNQDCPDNVTIIELCEAAEKITGFDTIVACQKIGAVWRLHGKTMEVRAKLVSKRILIRGKSIPLFSQNPLSFRDSQGKEIPATRLTIGNVPVSIASVDLEGYISRAGAKLRSPLFWERVRYPNGQLSRFASGKRFVWIDLPSTPLPKTVKIGDKIATLFYREQPKQTFSCFSCGREGHRRGDATCPNRARENVWGLNQDNSSDVNSVSAGSEDESCELETSFQSLGESLDAISSRLADQVCEDRREEADSEMESESAHPTESQVTSNDIPSFSDDMPALNSTLVPDVTDDVASTCEHEPNRETPKTVQKQLRRKKKGKTAEVAPGPRSVQSVIDNHFPVSSSDKQESRKRLDRPSPSPETLATRDAKTQKTNK